MNQSNNVQRNRHKIASIRGIYSDLRSLKNYQPSKRVNRLFTQLVQYVLNPESKNQLSKKEISELQKICQIAEYELEKYWSQKIIKSANPGMAIKNFPYFENYTKLTQLEWYSLLSCTTHKSHNVCFVGGGPLPLTAILLAEKYIETVTILDKDRQAVEMARRLVRKLNLDKKITVIEIDAGTYEGYEKFNVIMVAALAGIESTEKEKILFKIKQCSNKETHILARSSWGMRELLYRPLDTKCSLLFDQVMEVMPQNDVINSVVIFKNTSL